MLRSNLSVTVLLAALLPATVGGCATRYGAAGATGGYSETQVASNTFRVTFRANAFSRQADADEMALLRSAQVALQHGFPFFTSSGAAPTGSALLIATNVVSVPASTVTIVGYPWRPETTATVYDAQAVVATLGAKYLRSNTEFQAIGPPLPPLVPASGPADGLESTGRFPSVPAGVPSSPPAPAMQ